MADDHNRAELKQALGKKIKGVLASYGQSPLWLSEAAGIELPTVYSILNGHQLPSLEKLRKVCMALNISVDWLLEIETDAFYVFAQPGSESGRYAEFESAFLGERGGERISVSRGFSIVHQPIELRRQVLTRIFGWEGETLENALDAFTARREVIDRLEKRRVEYVVLSEIEDFISRRRPWDRVDPDLIEEFIASIIDRLRTDPIGFDVVVIPRQLFLVNYEILNREAIVFDLGTVFLRQSQQRIVDHFLHEVEQLHLHPDTISGRQQLVMLLEGLLARNGKPGAADDRVYTTGSRK